MLICGDPQLGKPGTSLNADKDRVGKLGNIASSSTAKQAAAPIIARMPEPIIRRLALWASIIVGLGYILPNAATTALLGYILSTFSISSQEIAIQMSGTILFLIASLLLMILGGLIINWGIRYYTNASCREVIFVGVMFASFYLFCLGMGSALLAPKIGLGELLLVISPVLIMVSVALYTAASLSYRTIGALLGIASGVSLAITMFWVQPLKLVFVNWNMGWENIPFPGPFMSLALSEGMVVIAGSIAASIYSLSPGQKTKPASYALFSVIGLVYGISLFAGAFLLSFSLLNIVWKGPWLPPLYGLPSWTFSVVIFWSASLVMLEIGGFVLIALSCLGFIAAAKEFSQLNQT